MIDLHLHTNRSDGSDEPIELLEKVIQAGCKVFSITDHDDLRANQEILSSIQEKHYTIQFIKGCEISSVFDGRNLHLLCYGFNPNSEGMLKMIEETATLRKRRISAMFDHLRIKHNIIIPEEDQAEILSRKIPGKVHIIDVAMRLGVNIEREVFFKNYLDDMESREYKIDASKVIDIVASSGGYVSFAHPIEVQREYKIDTSEIMKMSSRLKDIGLTAIEVYHSLHSESEVRAYHEIASKCNLLVSGGSDYHGTNKDVKIGQLTNYGYVPSDGTLTILPLLCANSK